MGRGTITALRSVTLLTGCAGVCGAAGWLALPPLRAALAAPTPGELPLEAGVTGACAGLLLGCVGWLVLVTALTVGTQLAGALAPGSAVVVSLSRGVERVSPVLVRRLVTTSLGVALTAGLAAPAPAQPAGSPGPSGPRGLTGLPLPDRASGATLSIATVPREVALHLAPDHAPDHANRPGPPASVVVRPGDSLWSLAAGLLPRGAPDAHVAEAWQRLQAANVHRIGPDPDLILPGTRLVVPELAPTHREDAP